jgi:hypothetical protein
MIYGSEFHPIIEKIFGGDVKHLHHSEQIQANCPKCQQREGLLYPDGRYNLEINTRIRKFHCWKCEAPPFKGNLGRLIKILGGQSDYERYKELAGTFFDYNSKGDEKEFEIIKLPKEFISFKNLDVDNPEHMEAYYYLVLERKIPKELIEKYTMGFCTEGYYRNRVILPSYDDEGELNYFISRTYKNAKPPYLNPKANRDSIIFNEYLINWDSTVILLEGGFDFFAIPINTIPLLGKELTSGLFFKLKKHKPHIVIVLDPDAFNDSIRIYDQLNAIYFGEEYKVKIVKLNKGNYDIDEIYRKFGKKEVIKQLFNARRLQDVDYVYKR